MNQLYNEILIRKEVNRLTKIGINKHSAKNIVHNVIEVSDCSNYVELKMEINYAISLNYGFSFNEINKLG